MISLESAFATDVGQQREENQDRVYTRIAQGTNGEQVGLFIVCDGVGGSEGGQFASRLAVGAVEADFKSLLEADDPRKALLINNEKQGKEINEVTRESDLRILEELVRQSVFHANEVVRDFTIQNPDQAGNAGTTITMAVVLGNQVVIANVGDSRTYILRDGALRQISTDHSLVAGLVASGQIQPEEVFSHPQRNLIFRSLGNKSEIEVDTFAELLKPGDYLLLCSDGLWEMIQNEQEITELILNADNIQSACDSLVVAANAAGGVDNISVILVYLN